MLLSLRIFMTNLTCTRETVKYSTFEMINIQHWMHNLTILRVYCQDLQSIGTPV